MGLLVTENWVIPGGHVAGDSISFDTDNTWINTGWLSGGNFVYVANGEIRGNASLGWWQLQGTFPNDHEIVGSVIIKTHDTTSIVGLAVRLSADGATSQMLLRYNDAGQKFELIKVKNGTITTVKDYSTADNGGTPPPTSGTIAMKLKCVGNIYTITIAGHQYPLYDDAPSSDGPLASGGKPGVAFIGTNGDSTGAHLAPLVVNSVTGTITITTPKARTIFQRLTGTTGTILITGSHDDAASQTIEGSWNGGAFATIASSVPTGTFSGSLTGQATGQGTLTLRFASDHTVTQTVTLIGIGEVFIVAGQSNAVGQGVSNQTYSSSDGFSAGLYKANDTWANLTDPSHDPTGTTHSLYTSQAAGGSEWPLLATQLMNTHHVPVAFIPCAVDGTALFAATTPKWGNPLPSPTYNDSTLYGTMVVRALAAKTNGFRCVLWQQGESDALNSVSQANYQNELSLLAGKIATDLSTKLMPAKLLNGSSFAAGAANINAAIGNRWTNDINCVAGPNLSTLTTTDTIHVTDNSGLLNEATLWATAIAAILPQLDTTAPTESSATVPSAGTTLVLVFTEAQSQPLLPASAITGFSVKVNGVNRGISAANRTAATTITLTLASTVFSGETVTFSYNSGTGNVTDSATPTPNVLATLTDVAVTNSSTQVGDTTPPVVSAAAVPSAGTTVVIDFTETGNPPVLPASSVTGFVLKIGGVTRSLSSATRSGATQITLTPSSVIYSGETVTFDYAAGNVTDSAVTPNLLATITAHAVTNNSTQPPPVGPPAKPVAPALGVQSAYNHITWSAVSTATSYKLSRDGVEIANGITALFYDDIATILGHTYTLIATNSGGDSPASNGLTVEAIASGGGGSGSNPSPEDVRQGVIYAGGLLVGTLVAAPAAEPAPGTPVAVAVAAQNPTIPPSGVVFTPQGGSTHRFTGSISVFMLAQAGFQVLYTTDGSDPRSSPRTKVYAGSPVRLTATTTLRAATKNRGVYGPVTSAIYVRR